MILCAGESLIDMLPENGAFRPYPGGSVYNTAIALGRLGVAVSYLWPISNDPFGQMLLSPLHQAGVDTSLCPGSARPTTLAFVTLDHGSPRYSFHDEGTAGRMFQTGDIPTLPTGISALFIGGISLIGEPCGTTIEQLVQRARAKGILVMLDPNIRPSLIQNEAAFRNRLERLIAQADIVKLSTEDLAWLRPQDTGGAIADMLELGPRIILLTEAQHGASAYWRGPAIRMAARPVQVADSIGAGDTFNAGVLAALSRAGALNQKLENIQQDTLAAALEMGIRAAALTVSRPGANPPWAHELASD